MGICGSLMDIFDYPQARSAKKQNKKNPFFIWQCIRFALLCFAKLGCGSEEKMKIS